MKSKVNMSESHELARSFFLFSIVLAIAVFLAGCEKLNGPVDEDESLFESAEINALVKDLSGDLNLNEEETDGLRRVFSKHGNKLQEPGRLWIIAGELQDQLTDEQKRKMFALLNQYEERLAEKGRLLMFNNWPALIGQRVPQCAIQFTREQLEVIQQIRAEYAEKLEELKTAYREGSISREEFGEMMSACMAALHEEIRALLTDEQKSRYETCLRLKDEIIEEKISPAYTVMVRVLGLTEGQKSELIGLQQEMRRAHVFLNAEFKNGNIDRNEFVQGIKRIRNLRDEGLQRILDSKQYEIVLIHRALTLRRLLNQFEQVNLPGDDS